jgi:hypothetical protein
MANKYGKIPDLKTLCQLKIIKIIERNDFHPRLINDLLKAIPDHSLVEPVLERLIEKKCVTDSALIAFLVPSRTQLTMTGVTGVRNSIFRQIGYNCPNLIILNLSDCVSISNSVVRTILQGCGKLQQLFLDRCIRISDAAFDIHQSLFHTLVGCLSLEAISLRGCSQVTGSLVVTLNNFCSNLKYLNLSQCKSSQSSLLKHVFDHGKLRSLNLSYIDLNDETFSLIGPVPNPSFPSTQYISYSKLLKLDLSKSKITDNSLRSIAHRLRELEEIRLQWCTNITDEGIIALVEACTLLKFIDLKSCVIGDGGIIAIAKYSKLLRSLDLSWCTDITDYGIQQFSAAIVGENTLNLENSIQEFGIREYSDDSSVFIGEDVVLEVENRDSISKFDDKEVSSFTESKHSISSQLQKISVIWCSALTIASLQALDTIPTLKHIDIGGCGSISTDDIASFREVSFKTLGL